MKRIQRSRKKGWKMPANSVYVGRPSMWGNPFKVIGDSIYVDASYRRKVLSRWVYLCKGDAQKCVRLYRIVVTGVIGPGEYGIDVDSLVDIAFWCDHFKKLNVRKLRGKDLMCWCGKRVPCHADVLIELANGIY